MFKNDIEVLPQSIPDSYNPKIVLAAQVRLVLRHMPLALVGAIFTSLCLFFTMLTTYELNTNQKILNVLWVVYHNVLIGLLWLSLRQIFKNPNRIDIALIKKIFAPYLFIFIVAIVSGLPIFISMWYQRSLLEASVVRVMIGFWVFFHIVIIYVCRLSWKKLKSLSLSQASNTNSAVPLAPDKYPTSFNEQVQLSTADGRNNYLAHYAAYSVIFITTLAIGSLWALIIGKAFVTSLQHSTQVVVLLGLHMGLLSGGSSSLGAFWRTYISYVLPSVAMWLFLLFYLEGAGLTILAIAVISLYFFSIFFAKYTSINTLKAILINLENNNLVAQLKIKTKQVEEVSLAKTQLLAAASHDLRQPLQALSLFIEALVDTDLDSNQTQIVDYAKSASQSSREMLNTILDYAHLESGQMQPNIVATDLNSIIQNLADEFGIQAHKKQLSLRVKSTSLYVMTDPTMLALVLRNFMSNAIRYTDRGGILIGVRKSPVQNYALSQSHCQISVWDTGSGMTTLEAQHVFDSFYQLDRNRISNQGLGLGLAIVKGITQLLQADLQIKSILGQGSQFSVVLPICDIDNDYTPDSHLEVDGLQNKKILVVDDDEVVLKSMQLLLETWGCYIIAVQTLDDAVSAFKQHQPPIVITDFRLSKYETGEDVIVAIKAISERPTQFIVLTADTSPKLFKASQIVQPIVLHKPIDPKVLRQCLQNVVAQSYLNQ